MKTLIVNSSVFFQAGEIAKKIIVNQPTLSICENFLLQTEGNKLWLSSSNLQQTVRIGIPIKKTGEDFSLTIPAKVLQTYLKGIEMPITLSYNPETYKSSIFDGEGEAKFSGDDPNDFPREAKLETPSNDEIVFDFNELEKFMPFISKDELRPAMTGVFFEPEKDGFNLVASDGHRLLIGKEKHKISQSFILPSACVKFLKGFKTANYVTVLTTKTNVQFSFKLEKGLYEIVVTSRIIDERFPDYRSVIPEKQDKEVILQKKETLKQLDKVLKFADQYTYVVKLSINNEIKLSAEDLNFDHGYTSSLQGTHKGSDIEICFNGKLLKEVLSVFEDEVIISLTEARKAAMITSANCSLKALLMPKLESK